jgi:hypothetical protein
LPKTLAVRRISTRSAALTFPLILPAIAHRCGLELGAEPRQSHYHGVIRADLTVHVAVDSDWSLEEQLAADFAALVQVGAEIRAKNTPSLILRLTTAATLQASTLSPTSARRSSKA